MTVIPPSGSVPGRRPPVSYRPLPVWATVAAAYRSVLGEGSRLGLRTVAWFGILAAANLLSLALGPGTSLNVGDVLAIIVSLAAYVSLAVAWHRSVVVGESPRNVGETLRFAAREWRFLGIMLLAMLIIGGPTIIALMVAMGSGTGEAGPIAAVLFALAAAWALFAMARFTLAFPLVALDASPAPLRDSWRMTSRAWPRVLAADILAAIPFALAQQLVAHIAPANTSVAVVLLLVLGLTALSLIQIGVMSALASHMYLHLSATTPVRSPI